MNEIWVAVLLCAWASCSEPPYYAKELNYSEALCKQHAVGWAMNMRLMTHKEYEWKCEKISPADWPKERK